MEPISWSVIAGLVVQYGLPLAERIWQKASSNSPPTQADFDELKAMSERTPESLLREVLAANGVSETDPKAIEIFRLLKG